MSNRRRYKRRGKKRANTKVVIARKQPLFIRYKGVLQKQKKCTFIYSDIHTVANTGGTVSSIIYRLNGLNDPYVTGTGHQPRGYDQLMQLYDHYVVIGVNVDAQIINYTDAQGAIYALSVRDSNIADNNISNMIEYNTSRWGVLAKASGGQAIGHVNFNVNPNKWLGRTKPLADPDLKGSVSTVPNEQLFLHFGHTAGDTTSACTVVYKIRLRYTAILIEPKNPTES